MSLGEPQYPRKLMWWEYTGAKLSFVSHVFWITTVIVIIINVWKRLK